MIKYKTNSKVYKHKKLNQSDFSNLTLVDYRVFLNLISLIKNTDQNGNDLPTNQISRKYILTAKAFSDQFKISTDNAYTQLRSSVKKLMREIISIKSDLNSEIEFVICSYANYQPNEGLIEIEFNSLIMPYLTKIKTNFVLYDLKEVTQFKSLYSIRIYELLQEFRTTGFMTKSVPDLKRLLGVAGKYTEYKNLKARCLTPSLAEINNIYPSISLTFEEIKQSTKVVAITFHFKATTYKQITNPITKQVKNIYQKL